MAVYIEDPQIAASIDDLKSRWPAIGAAADHPLTEWFIQNRRKFSRASSPAFTFSHRRKLKNIVRPFCLIADMGDAEQWMHFAIVPLQYRDLVGIIGGYVYATQIMPGKYHRWFMLIGTSILATMLIVFLFYINTGDRMEHLRFAGWGLLTSLACIFSFSFWFLMNNPALNMIINLKQINTALGQNQGVALGPMLQNLLWIPVLSLMASFVVPFFDMDEWIKVQAIYLTIASLINLDIHYYYAAKDVNELFLRIVERESSKYSDYVQKIVGRN